MKLILDRLEHYALNAALAMFLVLCGISRFDGTREIISTTRDLLFLFAGISGFVVATQLERFCGMRLTREKKRAMYFAVTLLLAFSSIATVYAMLELGLIASLTRWD